MRRVANRVRQLRGTGLTVLVTGESRTGKELVARAIHGVSDRAEKPFVAFNCAAVPGDMVEAQLFGYRRGAFTGANNSFGGVIRGAAGGTLFLDEIGELAPPVQPKLLRFLEQCEIQPLGEQQPLRVDVRLIAATNRDLGELVAAGVFRADLYYRLNVIEVRVPPLRERREDIPLLVAFFLQRYGSIDQNRDIRISPAVAALIAGREWPGNVRELENYIRRLVVHSLGRPEITSEMIESDFGPVDTGLHSKARQASTPGGTLAEAVSETERLLISRTLARHRVLSTRKWSVRGRI